MPITVHQISLQGLAGAVFWCILSAVIFYVLGFATVDWERKGGQSVGLWVTCSYSTHVYDGEAWFTATQAMITIGLILLIASFTTIFIYMFVQASFISKTIAIIVFSVMIFSAVIFMLIGFIIFGAKHKLDNGLNWSYAFCIIGGFFSLAAGVLGIVQMKKSNVL